MIPFTYFIFILGASYNIPLRKNSNDAAPSKDAANISPVAPIAKDKSFPKGPSIEKSKTVTEIANSSVPPVDTDAVQPTPTPKLADSSPSEVVPPSQSVVETVTIQSTGYKSTAVDVVVDVTTAVEVDTAKPIVNNIDSSEAKGDIQPVVVSVPAVEVKSNDKEKTIATNISATAAATENNVESAPAAVIQTNSTAQANEEIKIVTTIDNSSCISKVLEVHQVPIIEPPCVETIPAVVKPTEVKVDSLVPDKSIPVTVIDKTVSPMVEKVPVIAKPLPPVISSTRRSISGDKVAVNTVIKEERIEQVPVLEKPITNTPTKVMVVEKSTVAAKLEEVKVDVVTTSDVVIDVPKAVLIDKTPVIDVEKPLATVIPSARRSISGDKGAVSAIFKEEEKVIPVTSTTMVPDKAKSNPVKDQSTDNRIPSYNSAPVTSNVKIFDELEEFQQLLDDDFMQPDSRKINKTVSPSVDVRKREPSNDMLKKAVSTRGNMMKNSNLFADDDQDDMDTDAGLGNTAFIELNKTNIALKSEQSKLKSDLNDTNKSLDTLQKQYKLLSDDNIKLKTQVQKAVVVPSLYGNNATKAVVLPPTLVANKPINNSTPPPAVNNVVNTAAVPSIEHTEPVVESILIDEVKSLAFESNVKLDESTLLMGSVGAADLAKSNTRLKTEISQLKQELVVKVKQLQELRTNYEAAVEEQAKLRGQLQKNPNTILRSPISTIAPSSNTVTTKLSVHSTAKKLGFDQSRITVSIIELYYLTISN